MRVQLLVIQLVLFLVLILCLCQFHLMYTRYYGQEQSRQIVCQLYHTVAKQSILADQLMQSQNVSSLVYAVEILQVGRAQIETLHCLVTINQIRQWTSIDKPEEILQVLRAQEGQVQQLLNQCDPRTFSYRVHTTRAFPTSSSIPSTLSKNEANLPAPVRVGPGEVAPPQRTDTSVAEAAAAAGVHFDPRVTIVDEKDDVEEHRFGLDETRAGMSERMVTA
jgi:hypothetical protein